MHGGTYITITTARHREIVSIKFHSAKVVQWRLLEVKQPGIDQKTCLAAFIFVTAKSARAVDPAHGDFIFQFIGKYFWNCP